MEKLDSAQQQLLASCSFYAGDFLTTGKVAERQKADPANLVQGLYWESKADQKLAIAALTRAGEIDADSPRIHVLLGDVFRQKRMWYDAEMEYRKAVALDPKNRAANISLAIVLFTELKTGEAFDLDRRLLAEDPNDPEANLLAGEILVQQNRYAEAEPYLSNCKNLKPEFMPGLHALWAGYMRRRTGFQKQFRSTRQDFQPTKMEASTTSLPACIRKPATRTRQKRLSKNQSA